MAAIYKTVVFIGHKHLTLAIQTIEKSFGGDYKLGPIDLQLADGDTVALFGKNGAGKTTLFQILTGSMDATSGKVIFQGKRMLPEACELKRQIGYLPQDLGLPRWVNGEEMLSYAVRLYELNNARALVDQALKFWDCNGFRKRPLAACSHGMQKRVALALATIHDPALLILDEPFSGLDLFHIKALVDTIKRRSEQGKTTILSTHVAVYAASLCNEALVLEGGQMSKLKGWEKDDVMSRINLVESHFFGEGHA